jgi:hypothetical protein
MAGNGSGWRNESRRHSIARKGIRTANGKRRSKSRYDTDYGKNLKMNDDVYKLRRKVMDIIYDAKDLYDLPRIDVRITSKMKDNALGVATLKDNILWIQEDTIHLDKSKYDLRTIVYHEILHAVFGVPHIQGDRLMGKYHIPLSRKEADNLFKKWAFEYGNSKERS